ncbi:hypothetical protein G9A89_002387 [Geosiphon pyriformis]|nr:hypothetical protein G9A89_002387 [Geosiphon pyriformis]
MLISVREWIAKNKRLGAQQDNSQEENIPAIKSRNGQQGSSELLTTIVVRALLKLFVQRGVRLESLLIDTHSYEVFDIEHEDEFMLIAQPEFSLLTSNIIKFDIAAGFNKGRLFCWMARNCRQIQYMNIDMVRMRSYLNQSSWDENGNLSTLIRNQASLFSFKLSGFDADTAEMDLIIPALASQSRSLRSLTFEDVDFIGCSPLKGLAACRKLEVLRFENVDNMWLEMVTPLIEGKFPRLRKVVAFGGICFALQEWAERKSPSKRMEENEGNQGFTELSGSGQEGNLETKKRKKPRKKRNKKKGKKIENGEETPHSPDPPIQHETMTLRV